MKLIDDIPFGNVATRGLVYALLMAASPMLLIIIFNYFFGISQRKLLLNKLAERFLIAEQFFLDNQDNPTKINQALSTQAECQHYLSFIKLLHLKGKTEITELDSIIDNSYRILIMAITLPKNMPIAIRFALAKKC